MTRTPGVRESPGPFGGGLVESSNSRIQIFDEMGNSSRNGNSSAARAGYISIGTTISIRPTISRATAMARSTRVQEGNSGRQREGRQGSGLYSRNRARRQHARRYCGRLFGNHLWRLDRQDECASLGQSNHAIAHTGGLRCRYLHIARRPVKTNFCKVCARAHTPVEVDHLVCSDLARPATILGMNHLKEIVFVVSSS